MSKLKRKIVLTVFIAPGGQVEGVYNDVLLAAGLGRPKIKRETNLEYSNTRHRWEATGIRDVNGKRIHAPTREACLRKEHEAVTDRLARKHGFRTKHRPRR